MMTDGQIAIETMDLLLRDSARVSGDRVREWLVTRDPDVLSVVYESVSKALDRIDGGVLPDVYFDLLTTLFSALLEKEGRSEYALSRYDAAKIYSAFLLQCVREGVSNPLQARLLRAGAGHLAAVYKRGNEAQRRCVACLGTRIP